MKKIKFRGKRKDNEEWIYGYPIVLKSPDGEKNCFILREDFEIDWTGNYPGTQILENFIEVIPDTIGQYINLRDKNGVEIYRGDVIRDKFGKIYVVEWSNTFIGYGFKDIKEDIDKEVEIPAFRVLAKSAEEVITKDGIYYENPDIEVIGNAFDDLEMLQQI